VKDIADLCHRARRAGVPMNMMVTIRAPRDVPASTGKRFLSRAIRHLGQLLRRQGQAHIGVTAYEAEGESGDLHAHHVVNVARGN
jgi:hypothetical protein